MRVVQSFLLCNEGELPTGRLRVTITDRGFKEAVSLLDLTPLQDDKHKLVCNGYRVVQPLGALFSTAAMP